MVGAIDGGWGTTPELSATQQSIKTSACACAATVESTVAKDMFTLHELAYLLYVLVLECQGSTMGAVLSHSTTFSNKLLDTWF